MKDQWVGGINMWKWEAEGQPKAVAVLVHSAYEHHRWYAWLIEKLRIEGFHVVMGDLPGHGEEHKYTRAHDETIMEYLLFIKKMMQNALAYELPVFIIGHGFGATLAIHFLHKSRLECAGVILSAPWLHLRLQPNILTNALTSISALTSNMKITHEMDRKILTRNFDAYHEINDELPYMTTVTVRWYRELQTLMKNLMAQQSQKLSLPILLMTAKMDKIAEPKTARKWLLQQNSNELQLKEWPNSYHNLFHDNERDEVFIYMRDFMNNVVRSIGYIV